MELLVPCGGVHYPPVFINGFFVGFCGVIDGYQAVHCPIACFKIMYIGNVLAYISVGLALVSAGTAYIYASMHLFIPGLFIDDRLCAGLHFFVVPLFVVMDGLDYLFPFSFARIRSIGSGDLIKRFCNTYRFRTDGGYCSSVRIRLLFFDISCLICAVRFNGLRKLAFLCRVCGFNV